MDNEIAPMLAELRQDHRNMALLLNLLEEQAESIFRAEDSDLELMLDIMHYMTVYPDTVHHPKEDKLYAELRAARPDLSKGLEHITGEHRTIGDFSLKLRGELAMAVSGNMVQRKDLVADSLRYMETLRGHMNWEESDLFRRIDVMIADGHTVANTAIVVDRHDPLFGAQRAARFEGLFNAIASS